MIGEGRGLFQWWLARSPFNFDVCERECACVLSASILFGLGGGKQASKQCSEFQQLRQ